MTTESPRGAGAGTDTSPLPAVPGPPEPDLPDARGPAARSERGSAVDRSAPAAPDAAPDGQGRPPGAPGARRRHRRVRRVPVLVWVVTGLHVALLGMCTVLYPPFTGPDETFHVDMAYAYSKGHGPYPPGGRLLARGIEAVYGGLTVPPAAGSYSDTPVLPRGQRPSIDAAGGDGRPVRYLIPNQMVQHPPLYYLVGAGVLRLPGADRLGYDRQVALLRWVSVLMVAPLPLLAWGTARRLAGGDGSGPVPLAAAVLPVTLPGLSHIGSVVNNDNLLTLLTGGLLLVLAGVLGGDLRVRTGALVGLLLGLGWLTKGLALVVPVPVAVGYLVAGRRHRRRLLGGLPGLAAAGAVSAAVGGWWWARNLLLYGAVEPSGVGAAWERVINGGPRPGGSWLGLVPKFVFRFQSRFWGGLGYPDVPTLPFLLPALLFTGLIFYGSGRQYVYNLRLPGIQGRYVYPALTGLAVLFALGLTRLAGRLARTLPLLLLAAGLLTQAWAWRLLLAEWWAPRHTLGDRTAMLHGAIDGLLRWSPWPTAATLTPFIAVALLSLAALAVAALAVRPRLSPLAAAGAGTPAAPESPESPAGGESTERRQPSRAPGGPAGP